ncbi:MAG TPA: hypothetical protein VIH82_08300 [Acidimicrobiia bacterium]|jgi:hypothetical protein
MASVLERERAIQCPGCLQPIDVSRPPDVGVAIHRMTAEDGRPMVGIAIGRVEVHRCQLCRDGAWR